MTIQNMVKSLDKSRRIISDRIFAENCRLDQRDEEMSILFPPKQFNLRIHTSIEEFSKDIEHFFKLKKWPVDKPEHIHYEQIKNEHVYNKILEKSLELKHPCDYHWKSSDLEIKVSEFYPDLAIKKIQYVLYIPGIMALEDDQPVYSNFHQFKIELPREYPARVDRIKIYNLTESFHPMFPVFPNSARIKICYQSNGEIDRILMDLLMLHLYEPTRLLLHFVEKTSSGDCNAKAQEWYTRQNSYELHQTLLEQWRRFRLH